MPKIILASESPRRSWLLSRMGLVFQIVPSDFEEYLDHNRPTEEIAKELGLGKASSVSVRFPEALVIAADTIVTVNGRQLGKPTDKADAHRMIKIQAGQTVSATSSLIVLCQAMGLKEVLVDTTAVVMKPYDKKLVEAYLATNDWQDKAGGWGIQSGAAPLIERISGHLETVLGLPVHLLIPILRAHDISCNPTNLTPPVPASEIVKKS